MNATLAARKSCVWTRTGRGVRSDVEFLPASIPINLIQIVSGGENASLKVSSRSLWAAEPTVMLNCLVYPRFLTSIGRRGPHNGRILQEMHEVTTVVIDNRTHSEIRQFDQSMIHIFFNELHSAAGQPMKFTKYLPSLLRKDSTLGYNNSRNYTILRPAACEWSNIEAASMERVWLVHSNARLPFGSLRNSWSSDTLRTKNPIEIIGSDATDSTISYLVNCY